MTRLTLRCSSLDRVLNCSHSLRLPKEEDHSVYATAGTEQHRLASEYLIESQVADAKFLSPRDHLETFYKGMDANTKFYVDYVEHFFDPQNMAYIEWSLKVDEKEDSFILTGTADAIGIDRETKTLHIIDLKSGFEEVLPLTNQLKGYALLAYVAFDTEPIEQIQLTIIQNEEISSITIEPYQLKHFKDELNDSIISKSYALGDHCRYCPSKIHCLKLREFGEGIITSHETNSPYRLLNIVRHKKIIESMLEDSKTYLLKHQPTWFERKTRNLKKWIDESKAPVMDKIMTPAAALKLDKKYESNITKYQSHSYTLKKEVGE